MMSKWLLVMVMLCSSQTLFWAPPVGDGVQQQQVQRRRLTAGVLVADARQDE